MAHTPILLLEGHIVTKSILPCNMLLITFQSKYVCRKYVYMSSFMTFNKLL